MPLSLGEWLLQMPQSNVMRVNTDNIATLLVISTVYHEGLSSLPPGERLAALWNPRIRQWHVGRDRNHFPILDLWRIIALSIRDLGHDVQALHRVADMLIELSQQPDVVGHDGQVVSWMTARPEVFWKDLPDFTFWLSEFAFHGISLDPQHPQFGTPQEQTDRYTNANMFAAIFMNKIEAMPSDAPGIGRKGGRNFARHCFVEGIETDTDANDAIQVQRLECHLPAVTNWFLVAGAQILESCRADLDSDENMPWPMWWGGTEGGQWLWTESGGFSMRRWAFWKQRLAETAQIVRSAALREKNLQALAKMTELERE